MSTVIYVAIVEGDQDGGYSAYFPDLAGCVTASETMLELPAAAREALHLHLKGMVEDGDVFPEPTAIERVKADPDTKEVGRMVVDVDVDDAPMRVNISIGAQFLKRVDVAAEARGMTRSGFLVEGARRLIEEGKAEVAPEVVDLKAFLSAKLKSAHPEMQTALADVAARYLTVPCDNGLAVIWDCLEESVIDVVEASTAQVLTLGAHMCKWPIGDPGSSEFSFCGRRASEGVYCVEHARIAYQPNLRTVGAANAYSPFTVSRQCDFGGGYARRDVGGLSADTGKQDRKSG